MTFNVATSSGTNQYCCRKGCRTPEGKMVTVTDSDRKRGGQLLGDKPLTQAEMDMRYRKANPEKYKEVHKWKPKPKVKEKTDDFDIVPTRRINDQKAEYRKVTLMHGNKEVSSRYVKFVDGKNTETIIFPDCGVFSSVVISDPLPIV